MSKRSELAKKNAIVDTIIGNVVPENATRLLSPPTAALLDTMLPDTQGAQLLQEGSKPLGLIYNEKKFTVVDVNAEKKARWRSEIYRNTNGNTWSNAMASSTRITPATAPGQAVTRIPIIQDVAGAVMAYQIDLIGQNMNYSAGAANLQLKSRRYGWNFKELDSNGNPRLQILSDDYYKLTPRGSGFEFTGSVFLLPKYLPQQGYAKVNELPTQGISGGLNYPISFNSVVETEWTLGPDLLYNTGLASQTSTFTCLVPAIFVTVTVTIQVPYLNDDLPATFTGATLAAVAAAINGAAEFGGGAIVSASVVGTDLVIEVAPGEVAFVDVEADAAIVVVIGGIQAPNVQTFLAAGQSDQGIFGHPTRYIQLYDAVGNHRLEVDLVHAGSPTADAINAMYLAYYDVLRSQSA